MPDIDARGLTGLNEIKRVCDHASDKILAAFEAAGMPAELRARVLALAVSVVFIEGRLEGTLSAEDFEGWCETLRVNIRKIAEEEIRCRNAKPDSARAAKPRRPRAG